MARRTHVSPRTLKVSAPRQADTRPRTASCPPRRFSAPVRHRWSVSRSFSSFDDLPGGALDSSSLLGLRHQVHRRPPGGAVTRLDAAATVPVILHESVRSAPQHLSSVPFRLYLEVGEATIRTGSLAEPWGNSPSVEMLGRSCSTSRELSPPTFEEMPVEIFEPEKCRARRPLMRRGKNDLSLEEFRPLMPPSSLHKGRRWRRGNSSSTALCNVRSIPEVIDLLIIATEAHGGYRYAARIGRQLSSAVQWLQSRSD